LTDKNKSCSFIIIVKSRRRRRGGKIREAVGDFIREQLTPLEDFADYLNREPGADAPNAPAEFAEHVERLDREVRNAWLSARRFAEQAMEQDALPLPAIREFERLAAGAPVTLKVWRPPADDYEAVTLRRQPSSYPYIPEARLGDGLEVGFESKTSALWSIIHMFRYARNPHRSRLRRCPECARWFVDATRNRSARRCSKACTVKWSNKQRPSKRSTRKRGPR
jgi:hypothetical protein